MTTNNDRQVRSTEVTRGRMEDLCRLIDTQLTCVRQGDISTAERLAEQADGIITEIAAAIGDGESSGVETRDRLEKLYRELMLVLEAEQQDVREKLKQLRQVRSAFRLYKDGLSRTLR